MQNNIMDGIDLNGITAREGIVFEVLAANLNKVVSKKDLIQKLSFKFQEVGENAIEVYVHRLRKKLEPQNFAIRTMRGLGYLMEEIHQNTEIK